MYSNIQQQKNLGFRKRKTTEHLGIDYRTANHYWAMTQDECQDEILNRERRKNLELYDGTVRHHKRQQHDN